MPVVDVQDVRRPPHGFTGFQGGQTEEGEFVPVPIRALVNLSGGPNGFAVDQIGGNAVYFGGEDLRRSAEDPDAGDLLDIQIRCLKEGIAWEKAAQLDT